MQQPGLVFDRVSVSDVLEVARDAGHTAISRLNDSGRRTIDGEIAGYRYTIQLYPNEGHAQDAFGALRFVAWFSDEAPSLEVANAYNAKFRFAAVVANEDCYELQHDIIVVGVSRENLITCLQQWGTSLDDCSVFLAGE